MPSRKAVIAGGAGVVVAALGYRAWNRGVLAGATGPAYLPWEEWRGSDADGTRRPLRSAILAASPHDTQPWLFAVSGSVVAVHADRSRHLGSFDPFRREMHLGLGCAIENFVCAAHAFGMTTDVQPANGRLELSPPPQSALAARIALRAGRPTPDVLFDAIPHRHTNRGPYRQVAIAPGRLDALVDLAAGPDVRVVFVSDRGARRELGAMIVAATERIIADPEMSTDSFRWIRTGRRDVLARRDGVTIDTSGTGTRRTRIWRRFPGAGGPRPRSRPGGRPTGPGTAARSGTCRQIRRRPARPCCATWRRPGWRPGTGGGS